MDDLSLGNNMDTICKRELYNDNNKKICCAILYNLMSTIKSLSGVGFMAALAIVLIFGNSFPNALSMTSLENKTRLYYDSPVKLIDNTVKKVVMINFDDGRKSQFIYAKPILDKYGFKAS